MFKKNTNDNAAGILKAISLFTVLAIVFVVNSSFMWGFFGHQQINRLAVFTLPLPMIRFYKANITYLTEAAVNPDRRRYAIPDEAPRHYIDLDHYGDSALFKVPRFWNEAVAFYSEDTLKAYGIVPWHINTMYYRLRDAFMLRDPEKILSVSADLGHYIADAHVPLHTTENYNGQRTGQDGIHGLWESRLPEMFKDDYDFFVGKAEYISNVQRAAWKAVEGSHNVVHDVLSIELQLAAEMGDKKYSFETRGRQTVKVYSQPYARAYHKRLEGMVEKRMRAAIKMVGDIWFTAWVDGGQPDLNPLLNYSPTEEELALRKAELAEWKLHRAVGQEHEH